MTTLLLVTARAWQSIKQEEKSINCESGEEKQAAKLVNEFLVQGVYWPVE